MPIWITGKLAAIGLMMWLAYGTPVVLVAAGVLAAVYLVWWGIAALA